MNKNGPIVIIEDDEDDQQILQDVFNELDYINELKFFLDGEKALAYIISSGVRPFLILSDINMPKLNGLELKNKVHNNEELRLKCIPFLFFTTASSQRAVIDAYSKSVQGFFVKPLHYQDIKRVMRNIVEYWKDCVAPNNVC